jgi:DNA polymerase elongation subunit (family B)
LTEFYTSVLSMGNSLLVRGVRDGVPFKEKVPYKPYHFVPPRSGVSVTPDARTLDGQPLVRVDFEDMNHARNFLDKYEGIENANVFGHRRWAYTHIRDRYGDQEYDLEQVTVLYFDIECAADEGFPFPENADKEITAVSLRVKELKVVFSTVDFVAPKGVVYVRCADEKDLLRKLIDAWVKLAPDVITGWNIEYFDIPYLVNRIKLVLGEPDAKRLSPWGIIKDYHTNKKYGGTQSSYRLWGIATIDLMQSYIKFTFKNQESFSLDYISKIELGRGKVDYSEHGTLHELWLKDPQKYLEYNLADNDLVFDINAKTGLIDQILTLAYDAKINYADAFTSVLLWEVLIDNHLFSQGIVTRTFNKENRKDEPIMGAFVKEPMPGKFRWVIGLDLDSLYPHLMMQYNISPETLRSVRKELRHSLPVEDIISGGVGELVMRTLKEQNLGYTPNGAFFRNDIRGFMGVLMDQMYTDRSVYKNVKLKEVRKQLQAEKDPVRKKELEALKTKYHNMQMAKKICLNSAYGALSNEWFAFYDIDLAEAITYAGQLAIKWVSEDLNEYISELVGRKGDYIIANDTDSCYINLGPLVDKFFPGLPDDKVVQLLSKVCVEKINPRINASYERLREVTNAFENRMSMKVESISPVGLWTAKKKYALNVAWDEGVTMEKPEVKIKGLSAIQSSTPEMCRDSLKDGIKVILLGTKEELLDLISKFEPKFKSAKFHEVAKTSNVTDLEKYHDPVTTYKPACPLHVRGSLIYNKRIKEMGLEDHYQRIRTGDKVKFCYLKLPNPLRENVVSVYDRLPKEMGLEKYIDYDTQFEKVYFSPLNDIAKVAGWDLTVTATLESLFN